MLSMVRSALSSTSCHQNQVPLQTHHVRQGLGRAIVLLHPSAPKTQKKVKKGETVMAGARCRGLAVLLQNLVCVLHLKLDLCLDMLNNSPSWWVREFAISAGFSTRNQRHDPSCQKLNLSPDVFPSSFLGFGHALLGKRQKKNPWAKLYFFSKKLEPPTGFFGPFFGHGQLFRRWVADTYGAMWFGLVQWGSGDARGSHGRHFSHEIRWGAPFGWTLRKVEFHCGATTVEGCTFTGGFEWLVQALERFTCWVWWGVVRAQPSSAVYRCFLKPRLGDITMDETHGDATGFQFSCCCHGGLTGEHCYWCGTSFWYCGRPLVVLSVLLGLSLCLVLLAENQRCLQT